LLIVSFKFFDVLAHEYPLHDEDRPWT